MAEAELPLRARRGGPRVPLRHLDHSLGARGRARGVGRAPERRRLRARAAEPEGLDALGRGGVRPRVRPRRLHDRRGQRLQHGRDGEQGPERLQLEVRAGSARHRDGRRLRGRPERDRSRVLPQLDRQPRHLPRLVPADAQGGADRLPRPALQRRHELGRGRAHRQRSRPAQPPVPRGCGPPGTPHPPRVVRGDGQLLHGDRLPEGRRGHPHVRRAPRDGRVPQGHGPLLRAP